MSRNDLISVGQMMDENRCVVQIADHFLVIQDRATRTVIGVGKREAGSFYFRGVEHVAAVSARDEESSLLWHKRFGHASPKSLSSLPVIGVSTSSDFSVDSFETCMQAKQTRDSFPISHNKSLKIFQLIHCDV